MMEEYLEFLMPITSPEEWKAYETRVEEAINHAAACNISFSLAEIEPPAKYYSRVKMRPKEISYFIETFSAESKLADPDNPVMDSVDVFMEGGDSFKFEITYDEFEKRLYDFFIKPVKKRGPRKTTEK